MTISNFEHQILTALISLEKKGLIRASDDVMVNEGYDGDGDEVTIPSIITFAGRELIKDNAND